MTIVGRDTVPRARAIAASLTLVVAGFLGCGGGSPPVPAAEDRAREVLSEALSAWQRGDSIEDLKQAFPSIVAADPKWSEGAKLSKFEVQGEGKPAGAERVFAVTLWLAKDQGEAVPEAVEYKVGTSPILTVFRSIF